MPREKYYHLNKSNRETILEGVAKGQKAFEIAKELGCDPTTVSRELKAYRSGEPTTWHSRKNLCKHYKTCTKHNLCSDDCAKTYPCARCSEAKCWVGCKDFEKEVCVRIRRFPYVCVGCQKKRSCTLEKYTYAPSIANAKADKIKRVSRSGIVLSDAELDKLDRDLTPLLRCDKQSVESALRALGDKVSVSASTVRRYIDAGGMSAMRIDLLSAPSRKRPRKRPEARNRHIDDGRSYADFLALDEAVQQSCWEADTVIGAQRDRKRFFTLVSRQMSLLAIRLLPDGTSASIVSELDMVEILLARRNLSFKDIFPIWLVDNGSEFADPEGMERSALGHFKRCRVFFCDPYSSWQKPKIEGIHPLIRRVLPKGKSFRYLFAPDAYLIASHINSLMRKDGSRPVQTAAEKYGQAFLDVLGIRTIAPTEVHLRPDLLK
jgi:IS30 family transposase